MEESRGDLGNRVPEELADLMIAVLRGVELNADTIKTLTNRQLICYIHDNQLLVAPQTLEQLARILEFGTQMSFFTVDRVPYTKIVSLLGGGPTEEELDSEIIELGLSTRVYNALARSGYKTIRHLIEADAKSLYEVRNFGEKGRREVEGALKLRGLIPTNAYWPLTQIQSSQE